MDVLDVAEQLWNGEVTVADRHPFEVAGDLVEVAARTGFLAGFSNVSAFDTDDGLVLVDTGLPLTASYVHEHIRGWSDRRLHTAVFSHGHVDHVFGVAPFEEEAAERGWAQPRVVAHEAMPARFARYRLTAGWNAHINRRQFGADDIVWPTDYREPDLTYRDRIDLTVGGVRFELHHARGETDDHTWTWVPERRVLCTGDLFIWATPNAGNPQKVGALASRARELAAADRLRLAGHLAEMARLAAPDDRAVLKAHAEVYEVRRDAEVSTMSQGVFGAAARDSRRALDD